MGNNLVHDFSLLNKKNIQIKNNFDNFDNFDQNQINYNNDLMNYFKKKYEFINNVQK